MVRFEEFGNIISFLEDIGNKEGANNLSMGQKSSSGLRLSLKMAINQMDSKFDMLVLEEVVGLAKDIKKSIDLVEESLSADMDFEKSLLKKLKSELNKHVVFSEKNTQKFSEIFREGGFQIFINTIKEANVIDSYNEPKPKFQAVCKAIFDVKEYKDNIFVYDLSQVAYVDFLNNYFKTKIHPDSMSKGGNHEEFVKNYLLENYDINK